MGRPDRRIKETGHQNAYFPMFAPEGLLKKEADHEGCPEVACHPWRQRGADGTWWCPHLGSHHLLHVFQVIQPRRDLPVLINQWANVVRWEKARPSCAPPNSFGSKIPPIAPRGSPGRSHAHAGGIGILSRTTWRFRGPGRKSEREKFAGAHSYSIEADGGRRPSGRDLP